LRECLLTAGLHLAGLLGRPRVQGLQLGLMSRLQAG